MLGKTHLTAGVAIAVCVMRPDTFPELLVGLGAAVVGSVISDIDVGSSGSGRAADRIIWVSAGAVAAVAAMTNSIGYEVLCGVGRRVPRVYLRNGARVAWMDYLAGTEAFSAPGSLYEGACDAAAPELFEAPPGAGR